MISSTPKKNSSGKPINKKHLPYLSNEEKAKIIALKFNDIPHAQIAASLGCSLSTVKRVLKADKKGQLFPKPKSGRPLKVSKEMRKRIIAMVEANRKLAPGEVIAEIRKDVPSFSCSPSLIRSILFKAGLVGRVCLKKPLLRAANKVKRLEWARRHKNWRVEQWMKVLWTDEKKFELFNSKRRQYCRRRPGEPLRDDTIQATVKHGGGSVMFWGCFAGKKVGDLHKINGIMDQHIYHQILVHHGMPSGDRLVPGKWVFVQDNDPKHSSKKVRNYLENKSAAKDARMSVMEWPSQSPDCNPLELLWEECDRQVKKRKPTNLCALEAAVREVWDSMSEEKLEKLVKRMPNICKAVIDADGGYFVEKTVSKRRKVAKQTVY